MEPLTPTSSPSRLSSLSTGVVPTTILPLPLSNTRSLLSSMQEESEALGAIFGTLHDQTLQLVASGETETTKELNKLRGFMKEQDQTHAEALAEIQLILNNLLEFEYFEHLKKQAYQEIEDQIEELVKEQVALCLDSHIPQHLQDGVAQQEMELKSLQIQLHNSESRHANASVKVNEGNNKLCTIYMANGQVSRHFPITLQDLFNLDAETCKDIMRDYELSGISDARERNLNYFMQFCGVTYRIDDHDCPGANEIPSMM